MMKERFRIIPTSHLILVKDGKILLSRRFNTGYEDGKYSVVAGHLDGNETFRQAMIREAREEAGISIASKDLEIVHVMHRKSNDERIDFFLMPTKWRGQPKIMEPQRCDEMRWFNLKRLPKNTIPYVRQAVEMVRKKTFYSEHGW